MGFIRRIFDFIIHPTHLRTVILVVFITVVIIPATVIVSQQRQNTKQRASVADNVCSPPYEGYLGCFGLESFPPDSICTSSCTDPDGMSGQYCYSSTKVGETCVTESNLVGVCDEQGSCMSSAVEIPTSTPVPSQTDQSAPTATPALTLTPTEDLGILKSNFFKGDEQANSIAEGNTYEPKTEKLFASPKGDLVNTLSFEYKIGSAMRQLGYPPFRYTFRSEDVYKYDFYGLYLFQKKHGHVENNFITKEIIILLDNELYEREKKDIELAKQYPPSTLFLEAPKNAPPKEHLAALFVGFLSALPDHLSEKPWTVEKFPSSGFTGESFGLLLNSEKTKYLTRKEAANLGKFWYCESMYYPEFGDCFSHSSIISTTWFAQSDRSYMNTIIHEYGHAIAEKIKALGDDGTIANADKQFSKISFGFENGEPLTLLRSGAKHEEFISGYAKTNGYEDFADSFSAYVVGGKIFRERAKGTIYLQRKYNFLRDKVFADYEYDTGDLDNFKAQIKQYPEGIGNHPHYSYNADYVWDYKYPPSIMTTSPKSVVPQDSPTPTEIIIPNSSVVPYCYLKSKGDADCDNKITDADEKIWEKEFVSEVNRIPTQKQSDFNNDGIISIADFNLWKTNSQDPSLPHNL